MNESKLQTGNSISLELVKPFTACKGLHLASDKGLNPLTMKDYIKAEGQQVNYIRVDFDYSKGGYNYFTYKQEPRGYYIHVSPVYRSGNMETYTAFSGMKVCLLEVTRKSNKAEAEALAIYEAEKQKYIDYIAQKHGLKIEA